ncbi:Crp/Fnr family transcriptional regulator [Listeria booriae]|uniref:Crp/Fnr family transcriptional regulator n=1 Tax=Listeria booriae TaxID=1552123 RepID=UPI001625B977|nr:Crp/Fnr family transcriptional regulator [Listeria booriae]MBC2056836.1 Crp/Fnr family transcriptional regulator [Listeria booriae]
MYAGMPANDFSAIEKVKKIFRDRPDFPEHGAQERIKKGEHVQFSATPYFFFFESGYLKYKFDNHYEHKYSVLVGPGDSIVFPSLDNELNNEPIGIALADMLVWKIEYPFFKEVTAMEDPSNSLLIDHLIRSRRHLYVNTIQSGLAPTQRALFNMYMMMDMGFHTSVNQVELPEFVTLALLADLANINPSYLSTSLRPLHESGLLLSNKRPWVITDVAKFIALLKEEKIPLLFTKS